MTILALCAALLGLGVPQASGGAWAPSPAKGGVADADEQVSPFAWVLHQSDQDRLALARTLGDDTRAQSISVLWLLSHDPSLDVRMAALGSALRRCPKERPGTCVALLRFFAEEQDAPGTWLGRDVLLHSDLAGGQAETLTASKLTIVSCLTALMDRKHEPQALRRALRLMAEDEDPEVQEAASAALMVPGR